MYTENFGESPNKMFSASKAATNMRKDEERPQHINSNIFDEERSEYNTSPDVTSLLERRRRDVSQLQLTDNFFKYKDTAHNNNIINNRDVDYQRQGKDETFFMDLGYV